MWLEEILGLFSMTLEVMLEVAALSRRPPSRENRRFVKQPEVSCWRVLDTPDLGVGVDDQQPAAVPVPGGKPAGGRGGGVPQDQAGIPQLKRGGFEPPFSGLRTRRGDHFSTP